MSVEQRAAVIAEARTWCGTPYHHMGRVKGVGVDCAMLLLEVYERAGVIEHVEPDFYPPDWMFHRSEERYLVETFNHAREILEPQPGDVLVVKFGRCFSHGAIVVDWPHCIHATVGMAVCYVDAMKEAVFREKSGEYRPFKFFSPWEPK